MLPLTTSQSFIFLKWSFLLSYHCREGLKGASKCHVDLINQHLLYHCHLSEMCLMHFWRSLRMEIPKFCNTSLFFTVRNNFLVCNVNLPRWNVIPLPPVSYNTDTKNRFVPSKKQCFTCAGCSYVPSQSSLLQAEQVKYPHSFLPDCFSDLIQSPVSSRLLPTNSKFSLRAAPSVVLQLKSDHCCVGWRDDPASAANYISVYSPQCDFSLFYSSMMLLTHVQLVIHSSCQLLFFRIAA